ncbi:MAG TPA: DUF4157 domain-containing protein [Rhodocyclaceae bacterium]
MGGAYQRQEDQAGALQAKLDPVQRVEEEEPLQGKFNTLQRVEEEEPLQGKFDPVQRVEEEEPLQGKFDTLQRVEEEEPLQGKFAALQRAEEEEPLQGKFEPVQRVEEEEPLQGRFAPESAAQLKEEAAAKPNNTGLPDNLKGGIESLSGMSMDNVKVHYNSAQPQQLNALAYAQGTDIHVAPGQEKHLPHEAWHVVQQAQGRVQPTMQMQDGVPVNNNKALEHEADVMGARASHADPVQRMAAADEFAEKHLATSEDNAKLKTESRTGKLGPAKKNSVLNYNDSSTKKAFDEDSTTSGPAKVNAVGWELEADKRGPGRKVTKVEAKAGKFKVTVSRGTANHCDGWE